jgi:hypothetical protein
MGWQIWVAISKGKGRRKAAKSVGKAVEGLTKTTFHEGVSEKEGGRP